MWNVIKRIVLLHKLLAALLLLTRIRRLSMRASLCQSLQIQTLVLANSHQLDFLLLIFVDFKMILNVNDWVLCRSRHSWLPIYNDSLVFSRSDDKAFELSWVWNVGIWVIARYSVRPTKFLNTLRLVGSVEVLSLLFIFIIWVTRYAVWSFKVWLIWDKFIFWCLRVIEINLIVFLNRL